MAAEPLLFEKAHVLCYRTFDIADEIDLEKARRVLTQDTRRLKLSRENSQYIELPNPPEAPVTSAVIPLRSNIMRAPWRWLQFLRS